MGRKTGLGEGWYAGVTRLGRREEPSPRRPEGLLVQTPSLEKTLTGGDGIMWTRDQPFP